MALSAKEAAAELGTDARTFRKFMRDILPKDDQPGQGNRYAVDEKQMKKLRKKFDEWAKGKKPVTKKEKVKDKAVIEIDEDEVADVEEELDEDDLMVDLDDLEEL